MAFPGGPGGMPGMNPNAGLSEQEQQMIKLMQNSMESCAGKTVMAGVMGGGLGAMFGLFMASMRYDTPMGQPPMPITNPTPTAPPNAAATVKPTVPTSAVSAASSSSISSRPSIPAPSSATLTLPTSIPTADLPLRQQLKIGLRDMYRSSLSSGRNFAVVGSVFSGTECAIEGLRAKNDLWNGVAGGCITGGVLARKAGPQAVAVGCAGFAAFSAAIDAYMRMPEDERSRPIA
ncbi:mitochondrial import inner membrane translocase, subunit Tim17/22 [Melanomma pulvis-pyrius CBS 109.77]|uniref:Mitochondrial import inner membrane translocase subunit TIM22 n=1 Tax=Melanomma pulvis-pyrius CBS 109.77 TaxID=1314802 RepID=A0A6A6XVX4_9PLEO|nr:mitochondrial import inner membrane translocase, subunit Tim17/22 [Melanomma pulvis-pyrius CBS 109.77]